MNLTSCKDVVLMVPVRSFNLLTLPTMENSAHPYTTVVNKCNTTWLRAGALSRVKHMSTNPLAS